MVYASGGGSAGPMQRATVAQQFVQSFGGVGPHGQAKGVGVGIRVEFNEARDLVVAILALLVACRGAWRGECRLWVPWA
jgi:hypothetical protein